MAKHLVSSARQCFLAFLLIFLTPVHGFAQNGYACQVSTADTVFTDSFEDDSICPEPCLVNDQILAVRHAADGEVSLPLEHVYVSYIRPTVGNDLTGFFLQGRGPSGPAIYVNIDPTGLQPALEAGDVISLTVNEVGNLNGLRSIVRISDLVVEASGQTLNGLVQDVSVNFDLLTNLDGYESELISLNGTVAGAFASAGTGFEAAILSTPGITGDNDLRLRLPTDLRESLSLTQGCIIDLCGTPMWRFFGIAQPSAWDEAEIDVVSCPAPRVVSAVALDATTVRITFDREINQLSVVADGSQFTFDNGLVAIGAIANGLDVNVTTTPQVSGQPYQVVVANTVTDTLGTGIDATANSASFNGFTQGALLLINELNANITNSCDLVELRVIAGGTMNGIYLKERTGTVLTFSDFLVDIDDLIVVHFDGGDHRCNGTFSTNETVSTVENPWAVHPLNYDTAYDWYTTDTGMTNTDNVLTLYHAFGEIMDAVLASDATTGTAAAGSETQAAEVAAAGHWQMVGGGIPAGGFVDDNFNAHAAQDLNGTGTSAAGDSIQRLNNKDINGASGAGIQVLDFIDNNDKSDWIMHINTFGYPNSGRVD